MRESTRSDSASGARQDCLSGAGEPGTAGGRRHATIEDPGAAMAFLECQPALARTIETEIIPRLMLLHQQADEAAAVADGGPRPSAEQVADFTALVMAGDAAVVFAFVQLLLGAGISLEAVYLDLLSPVARRLGELWEQDRCDFGDVTVGLWRLQQLVYELEPGFRQEQRGSPQGRRILLMPAPGDQHTFGLFMVGEFFLRAGWNVHTEPDSTLHRVVQLARDNWFDIAGFSAGAEVRLDTLVDCIRALRRSSRNPSIHVMVGGPIFLKQPELVAVVGADGMAADARAAVQHAERVVGHRERCI